MLDSQEDVTRWLTDIGLAHYAKRFAIAGLVGERLLAVTQEDLVDLGLPRPDCNVFWLAREALVTGDAPPTAPGPAAPDYALALNAEVITFCRDLAQHPPVPWVDTVSDQWPGPVAHEYHRLRELLADGHIVPAIWQLKDLAEILLKFPALVMARDLVEHGSEAAARQVRRALFSGPLSFGKWAELVRETLALTARQAAAKLVCPQLAGLFLMPTGATTAWLRTLEGLVTWRNEAFGHGALRLNPADFTKELQTYVGDINRALAEHVAANVWSNVRLHGEGPEVPDLTGWRTIRHRHLSSDATHVEVEAALLLDANGRSLRLAPLLALRRCTVCSKQDVFMYDSLTGRSREHSNFVVIDYLAGHRMTAVRHRAPDLAAEADRTEGPSELTLPEGTVDATYGDRQIEELLQDKALEARYIEPIYLRQPFETFLQTHDRGVFWLTAPGHVGKSIFVKGLADPIAVGGKPLGADILVAALFIKREIRPTARDLRNLLTEKVLKDGFKLSERGADFPRLDIDAANPAAEFIQHLQQVMKLKPGRFHKVVLCLDGLDELPATADDAARIADFLPAPDALPAGLYLLVTSRPLAECPPQVRTTLNHRFTSDVAVQRCMFDLDTNRAVRDPLTRGYLDLLRAYYEREIGERRLGDLRQAFTTFINGRKEVSCVNDLSRRLPRPLADAAQREWSDLTRVRVTVRSPANAPSLAETVVLPVVQRYEAAFHTVLDRAGSRFLYVAHLTGLLRDRTLALGSIADLPRSAGLYEHFLRQLERTLASSQTAETKPWELVQRLILLLTAAEQAHEWDYRLEPAGYSDPEFRGLPLDVLADVLGEPARTYRLVFALYSVKDILAAWKGEQARDASYRLGLKDFVATVAALWPEKVAAMHRQLALDGYEKWQAQSAEMLGNDAVALHTLAMLLAHAALSGDGELRVVVQHSVQIRDGCLRQGYRYYTQAQYRLAVQWWSRTLWIAHTMAENVPTVENRNALAGALTNKGLALADLGQLPAALECDEEAVGLYRRLVEREGRLELAGGLATALMNKGVALVNLGQLPAALECDEEAIGLYRRLVEREGRPELAGGLATALMNKGNALWNLGQLPAALECDEEAIGLYRRLVEREGRLELANRLAMALMNKGNALRNLGQLPAALECDEEAIGLYRRLVEREGRLELAGGLATALMNKGVALWNLGQLPAALECDEEAIGLYRRLVEREGRLELANRLAMALMNKGNALWNLGQLPAAIEYYDEAIGIRRRLVEREGRPELAGGLATALMNKGNALRNLGQLPAALESYEEAIGIRRRLVEREGRLELANDLAAVLMNKGVALWNLGQLPAALESYEEAIGIRRRLVEREGRPELAGGLATALMNKGLALADLGQLPAALESYEEAVGLYRRLVEREGRPELAGGLATALMNKGNALRNLGQLPAALESYEGAIGIRRRLVEREGRLELANDLAAVLMNKGNALADLGQLPAALESYEEAVGLYRRLVEREGRPELAGGLATALMNKGNALWNLEQLSAALKCYEEAIGLWEQQVAAGQQHLTPDLIKGLGDHFGVQRQLDHWETAAQDVVRVLVHAQPFLQGGAKSDLFQREYVNFIAKLRTLSPDERERLYAALGERAEEVRRLIGEPTLAPIDGRAASSLRVPRSNPVASLLWWARSWFN